MNSALRSITLALSALAFGAVNCSAAVFPLYTDETVADLQAGTTAWNDVGNNEFGDGATFGIFDVPGPGLSPSPFGTGNAIQLVDFSDSDKPEIHGMLADPLFEPFRVDFQSYNLSNTGSTQAIRFRMGNLGQKVDSENRAAFSVSWQADGDVGGKYNGSDDGNTTDVDTKNSQPLDADPSMPSVHDVTMIANASLTDQRPYEAFGESRILNPLSYDLYIDGELLNSSKPTDGKHAEFINGMLFHFEKSGSTYDPSLGLQSFGLFAGSSAGVSPNVAFDNIILTTGSDMGVSFAPEPTSMLLLLTAAFAGLARVRRRV